MKAYDSISWEFILHCLRCFGAPMKFVAWIRECISTPSYSIALNGSLDSSRLFSWEERAEIRGSYLPLSFCSGYGNPFTVIGGGC